MSNFANSIYILAVLIFAGGLITIIVSNNYLRKLVGLSIIQSSILLLYLAASKVGDGMVPIDKCLKNVNCNVEYTSPISHVLMLTAIVVGFATLCVAISLIYRMRLELIDADDKPKS
jgi:multicomponent Na+:H+ antiporter subunit C